MRLLTILLILFYTSLSFSNEEAEHDNWSSSYLGFETLDIDERVSLFPEIKESSANGDLLAKYYLAHYYLYGIGVKENVKLGLTLLSENAVAGHYESKKLYVLTKIQGANKKSKVGEYSKWHNELVASNDADVNSITLFYKYLSKEKSAKEAINDLTAIATKNQGLSNFYLAIVYSNIGNKSDYRVNLGIAADMKIVKAMGLIGREYLYTDQNFEKSIPFLKRAAAAGDKGATYLLGKVFFDRKEDNSSLHEAEKYLLLSTNHYTKLAYAKLGQLYVYKFGFEGNVTAEKYLLMAANQGIVQSQYNLALFYKHAYITTKGKEEFREKGLTWANAAKENGSREANALIEFFNTF